MMQEFGSVYWQVHEFFFSYPQRPKWLRCPPSLLFVWYRRLLHGVNVAGACSCT